MIKLVEKELTILSKWILRRFRPFIIGITGSSGKTTTKYFIGELVKASTDSVLISPGNLNTKVGIPLTILGYKNSPKTKLEWLPIILFAPIKAFFTFRFEKFLILEYGVDRPGDMHELIKIATPDIALISSIGEAHIEIFKSKKNIIKEKWDLALSAKDAVIANRQTLEQVKDIELEKVKANLFILPGMKLAKAENVQTHTNKTEFDLYIANKKYETSFNFFGSHNIDNLELAAFCAHLATGDDKKIVGKISKLSPLAGRGRRYFSKKNILVIDESYNANPASMKAALDNLKKINYGRRVTVLGGMAEIGPISHEAHAEIVKYAKDVSDYTIGVGQSFSGFTLDRWYKDVSELVQEADSIFEEGDVVLVKGSRLNKLEKLINYLEEK